MNKSVYFESGGVEEIDIDMTVEHDIELNLHDVAVIVNALDSIIYAESNDLLMRKLTGVLQEHMIVMPYLDWVDPELLESDDEEDEEEEEEDEEEEEED